MKKLLLIIVSFGVIWIVGNRFSEDQKEVTLPSPTASPKGISKSVLGLSENEASLKTIEYEGKSYRFASTIVSDASNVLVGVNHGLASGSGQIKDDLDCEVLTSAAFYGTNDRPIGMVVDSQIVLSPWQENQLFNGVVGMREGRLGIYEGQPDGLTWGVQAGPVLVRDGEAVKLNLKNDQRARRIIAGVTAEGQLLLTIIVTNDSLFEGPLLVDLPSIVQKIAAESNLSLQSVINLDGGTASTYLSPTVSLKELKPIGSYMCVE